MPLAIAAQAGVLPQVRPRRPDRGPARPSSIPRHPAAGSPDRTPSPPPRAPSRRTSGTTTGTTTAGCRPTGGSARRCRRPRRAPSAPAGRCCSSRRPWPRRPPSRRTPTSPPALVLAPGLAAAQRLVDGPARPATGSGCAAARKWYDVVVAPLSAPCTSSARSPPPSCWCSGPAGSPSRRGCSATRFSVDFELTLFVSGVAAGGGLYLGPGGSRVRRPLSRLVIPLSRTPSASGASPSPRCCVVAARARPGAPRPACTGRRRAVSRAVSPDRETSRPLPGASWHDGLVQHVPHHHHLARREPRRADLSSSRGLFVSRTTDDDETEPWTCRAPSTSTTPPCATARSRRVSTSPSPTSSPSRGSSTTSAWATSRAAGRARTPRTPSSSAGPRTSSTCEHAHARGVRRDPPGRRHARPTTRWSPRCATAAPSVVTLVAKSHERHVELALRTTLEENLAMVRDTVAHLRAEGQEVFLDAEHFFDGYRLNRDYALEVLRTAYDAGAEVVALCDTNGGMLPTWVADVVARRRRDRRASGSASTATTTPAARSPTRWPRSTPAPPTCRARVNGYGERTGNADLLAVVANLELKLGRQVLPDRPARRRHPDRPRRRRGHQRAAGLAAAVRRRLGVRAQGRPARQRDQGRPRPLPAHGPGRRRQRHAAAGQRHGRPRVDRAQGPRARLRPLRRPRRWSPGSPTASRSWRPAASRSRPPTRRSSCCSPRRSRARGRRTSTSSPGGSSPRPGPATRRCPRRRSSSAPRACATSSPARATARSTRSTTRCARRSARRSRRSPSSS